MLNNHSLAILLSGVYPSNHWVRGGLTPWTDLQPITGPLKHKQPSKFPLQRSPSGDFTEISTRGRCEHPLHFKLTAEEDELQKKMCFYLFLFDYLLTLLPTTLKACSWLCLRMLITLWFYTWGKVNSPSFSSTHNTHYTCLLVHEPPSPPLHNNINICLMYLYPLYRLSVTFNVCVWMNETTEFTQIPAAFVLTNANQVKRGRVRRTWFAYGDAHRSIKGKRVERELYEMSNQGKEWKTEVMCFDLLLYQ